MLSRVRLCDPMDCQASLSVTNSRSLLKLMSIDLVMPFNHLILCRPLLLRPLIFPSIRVFSKESVLHIRWPKYWSFSFNISPSIEHVGLVSFRIDWLARKSQKIIYFCFIDYTKAFDCMDHNKVRTILKEMGIPDHLTCLLRNLYAGQEATVRSGHGVHQQMNG